MLRNPPTVSIISFYVSDVAKWKSHRKLISPTFNQKILNGFVEIFIAQSDKLSQQLENYSGKGEFDLFRVMSTFTLNAICVKFKSKHYLSYVAVILLKFFIKKNSD